MVILGLLTGHWGACGIGLIIFVVGNNARCSLQVSELTCYVALSGCAGSLDALDFLQRLLQGHYITFAFPFADNLALNLEVFSVWMAPVAEILGARTAWGCYLNPSMLFETPSSQVMSMSSQYAQPMFHPGQLAAAHFRTMPSRPPDPMRTRMPGGVWGEMASMMPGWPGAMAMDVGRMQPFGSSSTEEQRVQIYGLDTEGYASSSRDRPHGFHSNKRRNDIDVLCTGCGDAVPAGEGWLGTGVFHGQVYCSSCWAKWTAP